MCSILCVHTQKIVSARRTPKVSLVSVVLRAESRFSRTSAVKLNTKYTNFESKNSIFHIKCGNAYFNARASQNTFRA